MSTQNESLNARSSRRGVEAFSSVAKSYEDWFASPLGDYIARKEMKALDRIFQGVEADSVVEVGAGTGYVARHLATLFGKVVAVEPSREMREEGMRRTVDLHITWYDSIAEALPFDDGSFACAVFFTALEFVEDPERAIREAIRVVRSGGWLVVGFLHALSPWVALYRRLGEQGEEPWCAARFYTREDIERWVGSSAEASEAAVFLAPGAAEPYDTADAAGVRAGNAPALEILRWRI